MSINLFVIAILSLSVPFSAITNAASRIVFLAGDPSPRYGEHEFYAGSMLLADALNNSGLDVKAEVYRGWPEEEGALDDIKSLVVYAGGTSVVSKGWQKVGQLAKNGTGILFLHHAVQANKRQGKKYYLPWIGGVFEKDYSVNPHWVAEFDLMADHSVSRGVKTMPILDEFYFNIRFQRERESVLDLVTATPTRQNIKKYINLWNSHGVEQLGKKQTLLWGVERPDGGRGAGFVGGHFHRNWSIDSFRTLVLNTIVWTAGMEVPENGVKSKTPTVEELNANLDGRWKGVLLQPVKAGDFDELPSAPIDEKREAEFAAPKSKKHKNKEPAPKERVARPAFQEGAPKPVAKTGVMTAYTKRLETLEASLEGATDLYLVVDDLGETTFDWANWIEPTLHFRDGSTKPLTDYDWVSAIQGWKAPRKNQNAAKKPIRVGGKTFDNGIGTHSYSIIHFKLPENVVRITTHVGIDDAAAIREGKETAAELAFEIYTQEPKIPGQGSGFLPADMFSLADPEWEVTLWATTPMLYNPTNIDFDAQGRLWVTEGVNYRRTTRVSGDRVVVLSDTDGDGVADTSQVFVQEENLEAPLGIAVMGNQILVSQAPDLLLYTDVDGDQKFNPDVDKREVFLTGFNGRQHDHSLHSVTAGPDGRWHFSFGNTGAIFTDRSNKTFRFGSSYAYMGGGVWYFDPRTVAGKPSDDGHVWIGGASVSINPDGTDARVTGHNYRNSYERAVNSFGDIFQSDNDDPPACRVSEVIEGGNAGFSSIDGQRRWEADRRPGQDIPTAEWRQEDPGTMPAGDIYGGGSPTGVAFYENGALGAKWRGLLLAAEAGKNVIYGYLPKPDGAGFTLDRIELITSNPEGEYAGSDFLRDGRVTNSDFKTYFRPSDVAIGPDGALYVADWFDPRVGGHGTKDRAGAGSIYRIAPKGFKSVVPKIDLTTIAGAITALKSPTANIRWSGFMKLREEGGAAIPELRKLLAEDNPWLAARAVWLLVHSGPVGSKMVNDLLKHDNPRMRLLACRALRSAGTDVLELARRMVTDSAPMVRREIALAMRDVSAADALPILTEIGLRFDGRDRAYLEAFGLGCKGKESEVFKALKAKFNGSPIDWPEVFDWIAWRLHPAEAVADQKARIASGKLEEAALKRALTALGFTHSADAAEAMVELAANKEFSHHELAKWWIGNRQNNLWKEFNIGVMMVDKGVELDNKILVSVEMPAEPKESKPFPPVEELAQIKGDSERGKEAVAACYMCHQIGDKGVDFGPDLTEFGRQQPTAVILDAIVNPSADISHGYDGTLIITKDRIRIEGIVIDDGDPVVIRSMGGLQQRIARKRIDKIKPLKHSLMFTPQMLDLSPQSVADIVEYLKKL